jgi:ABC-2 type transport system permease protein
VSAGARPAAVPLFAPVPRRQGFALHAGAAVARAYVRVVGVNRELSWMFSETVLPVIGTAAYIYMYRALGAAPAFEGFALLGGAMTSYWFAVLWGMAAQFYWDKEMGNLEFFLIAPSSRMSILVGMALGSMVPSTVRCLAILGTGMLLFGIRFEVSSWAGLAGTFLLTLTSLYAVGMLAASLFFAYGRSAWQAFGVLQEPVFLAAGFYFPVRKAVGLEAALVIGSVVPLAFGLDALRQLTSRLAPEDVLMPAGAEAAVLAALTAAFTVLAALALRHMENLAKREGRLTLKWQ